MKIPGILFLGVLLASTRTAEAAERPSFDCSKAHSAIEHIVCADPRLASGDRKVAAAYKAELASVSSEGQESLRNGQRQWLAMIIMVCTPAKPNDAQSLKDAKDCLTSEYDDRLKRLDDAVQRIGGITVRRVDVYRALKNSYPDIDSGEHPGFSTMDFSYPVIDAPKTASERAFNRDMQKRGTPDSRPGEDDTDYGLSYDDLAVTPRLISVDMTDWYYSHGTPHGQYATDTVHWLRSEGRLMTPDDVFAKNTPWKAFLRERCFKEVAQYGFVHTKDDLKEATESNRWTFGSDGLTISFRPYEVASYADGQPTVLIPWAALKPYLLPTAPVR